ncbi:MAG: nitroreductase family protein [Proteobacteria bacterium]|nr:nitroreductase family protein [Pseudomonadota bacterium]
MQSKELGQALVEIIESRRSIRLFDKTPVPAEIIEKAFDLALLAPNSSNLQPWEFFWVREPKQKAKLVNACFSQAAAATAAELVVCIARTRTWKRNCEDMKRQLEQAEAQGTRVPKAAWLYYRKLAPFMYTQGPFGILGFVKRIFFFILGFWRPVSREPMGCSDMKIWATKTTALACENFMLSIRAFGFDTCPMEGIDSRRIKKLLSLPSDALVPMVIAIGKRRADGVTLPRIRGPRSWFIKTI